MTTLHQQINTHHKNHNNQVIQWFRLTKTTGKCTLFAKMNTIDNQSLTHQKP
jgi:hypothetical protein